MIVTGMRVIPCRIKNGFAEHSSVKPISAIVAVGEPDAHIGSAASEANRWRSASASDRHSRHLGQVDCVASVLDHEPSLDLLTTGDRGRTEFQPISESSGDRS